MSPLCLFCGEVESADINLVQIIDSFKLLVKLLEEHSQLGSKQEMWKSKLEEVITQNRDFKKEKEIAEERSNTYKTRFLHAQDALQKLHRENIRLSRNSQELKQKNSNTSRTEQAHSFPFAPERSINMKKLPGTDKVVLAPDTCFFQPVTDVTYISSDEEPTTIDPPHAGKHSGSQNQSTILERPSKKNESPGINDSFFTVPKSSSNTVKKELATAQNVTLVDMDETRMDFCENAHDDSMVSPHSTTKIDDHFTVVIDDNDSIPPSPVLVRERRAGMIRSNKSKNTSVKGNFKEENENVQDILTKNYTSLKGKPDIHALVNQEDPHHESNSQNWAKVPAQDSLQLLRKKKRMSQGEQKEKSTIVNTSLDDLFEKTDGDLETTTMLNNTTCIDADMNLCTVEKTAHELDSNDEDEELDALLLQGIEKVEKGNLNSDAGIPVNDETYANSPSSVLGESFDFAPKKVVEKPNFKYQDIVRKQNERKNLEGKACAQCEAFFLDLPPEERKIKLQEVCRHKHVYAPPSTPDHFWDVDFPNTAECKRRGYIADQADLPTHVKLQQQSRRLRRKKPLGSCYELSNK